MDQYYFYVRDHLGSNRAVVNQNGGVEQRADFYPYGGTIPGNWKNRLKLTPLAKVN